jgi:hypothetical protein
LKPYVEDIIKINIEFYRLLIKINQLATPNKYPSPGGTCDTVTIPTSDVDNGINNSDIHLYITHAALTTS